MKNERGASIRPCVSSDKRLSRNIGGNRNRIGEKTDGHKRKMCANDSRSKETKGNEQFREKSGRKGNKKNPTVATVGHGGGQSFALSEAASERHGPKIN